MHVAWAQTITTLSPCARYCTNGVTTVEVLEDDLLVHSFKLSGK
jgi:hypothetical protein